MFWDESRCPDCDALEHPHCINCGTVLYCDEDHVCEKQKCNACCGEASGTSLNLGCTMCGLSIQVNLPCCTCDNTVEKNRKKEECLQKHKHIKCHSCEILSNNPLYRKDLPMDDPRQLCHHAHHHTPLEDRTHTNAGCHGGDCRRTTMMEGYI